MGREAEAKDEAKAGREGEDKIQDETKGAGAELAHARVAIGDRR